MAPSSEEVAPDARRVVFLHGLFGRGKNFTRIAAGLAPEARSLLVDLPNHGQSAWTETIDYPGLADAIAAHLREGFAVDGPVDVVGHSMGGKVAMMLALRHPDLVRRLVVVDISPVPSPPGWGNFQHLLASLASLNLGTLTSRSQASEELTDPIPNPGVRGFLLQNLARRGDGFEWEPNLDLLRRELPTIMGFPDAAGAHFDGPVLWIAGERSPYVRDEDAPAMRALFPRVRRLTVKGASHWVHSDKPEEFIAALRSFLLAPGE
nr:alpha/beta fold hydrolase [Falsarthrobacter nasiphocae]